VAAESALAHFWELLQNEFCLHRALKSLVHGGHLYLSPRDIPFLHFPHVVNQLQVNNVHRLHSIAVSVLHVWQGLGRAAPCHGSQ
jgi:hypothetical protein